MAERATGKRRSRDRGPRTIGSTERRLDALEARVDALERLLPVRGEEGREQDISRCSDIIGCLEDCAIDVRELRKKVRDVRS
jgi:hypothetical protein